MKKRLKVKVTRLSFTTVSKTTKSNPFRNVQWSNVNTGNTYSASKSITSPWVNISQPIYSQPLLNQNLYNNDPFQRSDSGSYSMDKPPFTSQQSSVLLRFIAGDTETGNDLWKRGTSTIDNTIINENIGSIGIPSIQRGKDHLNDDEQGNDNQIPSIALQIVLPSYGIPEYARFENGYLNTSTQIYLGERNSGIQNISLDGLQFMSGPFNEQNDPFKGNKSIEEVGGCWEDIIKKLYHKNHGDIEKIRSTLEICGLKEEIKEEVFNEIILKQLIEEQTKKK